MSHREPKKSLVLLSGLLCDDFMWRAVANQLADIAECSIFSFAGFSSIPAMADNVLQNASQQFALAGHSMGGRVALEIFRKAPERVTKLALLNTGVHPRNETEVPGRQRLVDLAFSEGIKAVMESWLPPMMSPAGLRNEILMAQLREMVLRHSPADFNGEIQALLNRPDAEAVLPGIEIPTLLLSGSVDNWSPVSQHREIQQQIPGSRLVALDGVGHMSTVEAPELIATELRNWLTEEA